MDSVSRPEKLKGLCLCPPHPDLVAEQSSQVQLAGAEDSADQNASTWTQSKILGLNDGLVQPPDAEQDEIISSATALASADATVGLPYRGTIRFVLSPTSLLHSLIDILVSPLSSSNFPTNHGRSLT
jgi:hypothetical protein